MDIPEGALIGWKIVNIVEGRMWSYASPDLVVDMPPYCHEYKVGEWTRPRGIDGPLALFDAEDNAKAYFEWGAVHKCAYIPSSRNFLYETLRDGTTWTCKDRPLGMIYADAIMLLS